VGGAHAQQSLGEADVAVICNHAASKCTADALAELVFVCTIAPAGAGAAAATITLSTALTLSDVWGAVLRALQKDGCAVYHGIPPKSSRERAFLGDILCGFPPVPLMRSTASEQYRELAVSDAEIIME
jgi:hypothetical protein